MLRPLLMRTNLPNFAWLHFVLRDVALIYKKANKLPLIPPIISFRLPAKYFLFKNFWCAIYVPIAPLYRTKMGLQRKLGIYIGYDSFSLVKILETQKGDVFKTQFIDCQFDEIMFSILGGESKQLEKKSKLKCIIFTLYRYSNKEKWTRSSKCYTFVKNSK